RIVASLVIGLAALAPLLAGEAWLESQSPSPPRPRLGRADPAPERNGRPWTATPRPTSVGQARERIERRLALPPPGPEALLPAADVGLVLELEPEHHVDPRVLAGDRERLLQVERLFRVRNAEEPVRRVGLVRVLRQPDRLPAPVARHLLDHVVEVAEREGSAR